MSYKTATTETNLVRALNIRLAAGSRDTHDSDVIMQKQTNLLRSLRRHRRHRRRKHK